MINTELQLGVRIMIAIILIVSILIPKIGLSDNMVESNSDFTISMSLGSQMSGIKGEDFVFTNYSPFFSASMGYWFAPTIALQLGYKGNYYYLITDNKKHYYSFYFGEATIDLRKLFLDSPYPHNAGLMLHLGAGNLYSYDYKRPNICATFGVTGSTNITSRMAIILQVASIIGWDIYQGDEDILPNLSFGVMYRL